MHVYTKHKEFEACAHLRPFKHSTWGLHQKCHLKCAHTHTHISSRKHFTERVVRHVAKHLQIFRDKGDRSVWLTGIEPGKTFGMREMEWTAGGDVVPHRASSHGLIFSSCNI